MSLQTTIQNYTGFFINGMEFFYNSIEDSYGNKLIVDELPNKGRVVQFFGDIENEFTIDCLVDLENKGQALTILKQKTALQLDLPFGERFYIYIDKIKESGYNRLGLVKFQIKAFTSAISTNIIVPTLIEKTKSNAKKMKTSALDRFNNFFKTNSLTIARARGKVEGFVTNIQSVSANILTISDEINQLTNTINGIQNSINSLIAIPSTLASSIDNVFTALDSIFVNENDKLDSLINIINIGGVEQEVSTSPAQTDETRLSNIFDSYILSACVNSYLFTILNKEFVYANDIIYTIKQINIFEKLNNNISDFDVNFAIQNVLDGLKIYLQDKAQYTKQYKEIVCSVNTTDTILCYNIFGNLDNFEQFKNWNDFKNDGYIEKGEIIKFYI